MFTVPTGTLTNNGQYIQPKSVRSSSSVLKVKQNNRFPYLSNKQADFVLLFAGSGSPWLRNHCLHATTSYPHMPLCRLVFCSQGRLYIGDFHRSTAITISSYNCARHDPSVLTVIIIIDMMELSWSNTVTCCLLIGVDAYEFLYTANL